MTFVICLSCFLTLDSTNRDSLDIIERCIFVICLDKSINANYKILANGHNSKKCSDDDDEDDEEEELDEVDYNCNQNNGYHREEYSLKKSNSLQTNGHKQDINSHENLTSDPAYNPTIALNMLHGLGSNHNSGNRWFDKTMQVRR